MNKTMGRTKKTFLFVIVIAILASAYVLINDPDEVEFNPGIKKINVEYYNRKIYLDVYTNKKLTCESVINTLGIEPIMVKSKTYNPTCAVIDESLVQVTYEEGITL